MQPEKNQVEVVGDGINVVVLTKLIRKNVAYEEIVSVGKAKKEEAAVEKLPRCHKLFGPSHQHQHQHQPHHPVIDYSYHDGYWNYASAYDVRGHDPSCNIM